MLLALSYCHAYSEAFLDARTNIQSRNGDIVISHTVKADTRIRIYIDNIRLLKTRFTATCTTLQA
jgi:hypothetical protein